MTLIAFACYDEHVEILTDSLAYTRNVGKLGTSNKVAVLPNLNAAVMVQGDGTFGGNVRALCQTTVGLLQHHSFDGLTREIQPALQDFWGWTLEGAPDPDQVYDSTVYLVGYSGTAGRFTGHLYASEHGFEPEPVEGLHVHPMPFTFRPHPLELERVRRGNPQVEDLDEFLQQWAARPECPPPTDRMDWAEIGLTARHSRALRDFGKVLVGGSLYFTHLERDMTMSRQVFDFDDSGEQLLDLVGYSQHPVAQTRPCWCGSGKRHLDCHLADQVDQPCGCGSGSLFRDCCMIS